MSDLEKQFFEVFGIEPEITECNLDCQKNSKMLYLCGDSQQDCEYCERYPQITDHILLELICLLTAWHLDEREPYEMTGFNIESLKRQVLEDCIQHKEKFRNKVQALFKESNW